MTYKKGNIYPYASEDGIWIDYKDNCWYFFIKDKVWQKEEIQRTEHSTVTVSFVQKGIADAFLLSIYDCLEPSDIPFSILDGDEALVQSLKGNKDYSWEIVLLNEDNKIAAVRDGIFNHENSTKLKNALQKRTKETFTDADLDHAIAKIEKQYEPYELEQFALFTEVFAK